MIPHSAAKESSAETKGAPLRQGQENLPINPLITLFLPLEGRHSSVEQMKPLKQDEKGDRQISTSRLGEIRGPQLHPCQVLN
jgi:hypothetical protein